MEKMTEQALDVQFPQQREFLRHVSPESNAVDYARATQGSNIQINVTELKRDEEPIVNEYPLLAESRHL